MSADDFDRSAWMSVNAAAAALGIPRSQVQKRIMLGQLETHHVVQLDVILVSKQSVDAAIARGEVGPRKRKRR